jgi:tetratricopeptide (TPR) repeat protein
LSKPFNIIGRGACLTRSGSIATALRESPHDFDTLHFFGVLKLQQGGAGDALPLLQKAIEVRPNSLDVLSNLSVALLALNRPAEALANFDKILSVAAQDASALFGRGTVLAQLGRPMRRCSVLTGRSRSSRTMCLHCSIAEPFWPAKAGIPALSLPMIKSLGLHPRMSMPSTTGAMCWLSSSATPRRWQASTECLRSSRITSPH